MLLLCWHFNRSRLFFSLLTVGLMYVVLTWVLPKQPLSNERLIHQLLYFLVPFNLLVFSELKERGVLTWWGSTRFMILVVPAMVGWVLIQYKAAWLDAFFTYRFLPDDLVNWTMFSQPAQVMALISLLIMNGLVFAQPNIQRGALFGSLIGLFVVLHYTGNPHIVSVFTSAVLLMVVVALIHESWSMAYIDHLTGLPGRRALNDHLLKLSGTYSIAMMDIDHFKKFNDTYGHDAGDEVLRMVASRIRKVGSGGKVYRYGGEEFSVVFSGRQTDEVMDSLEEIRERVAESAFQPQRKDRRQTSRANKPEKAIDVQITISIGVAERNESCPVPADVIKAADKALYKAKKKGRNQVSC